MNFKLNTFIENQAQINNNLIMSNGNINNGINAIVEGLDELTNNQEKLKNRIEILEQDSEEKVKIIDGLNEEVTILKDKTLVLATDDGKMKSLTNLMQTLAFKYNGMKDSLEYILFHRTNINECYKHLYSIYQINTYKRIKIEEFDEVIKVIKRWFANEENIKRCRNKKLSSLRNKIDKGTIKDYEENLYNKYMDKTEGGLYI